MEKLVKEIKRHTKAYNRYLTDEFLDNIPVRNLLGFCHPIYRHNYREKLNKVMPEPAMKRTMFATQNSLS